MLGYGTGDGGPIPGTDVARSAIDEHALRGVAGQIGVPYVARDVASHRVGGAGVHPRRSTGSRRPPRVLRSDRVVLGSGRPAAALVLIELYLVLLEFRRTRLVNADVIV